jgi:hypothetical protein
MAILEKIGRSIRGIVRAGAHTVRRRQHSSIDRVEEASDLGAAAARLSRHGRAGFHETLRRLRELFELATPALYLQVETGGEPCRIVLVPWDRRQVAFSGRGFHLLGGAEAEAGKGAFLVPKGLRIPPLNGNAPDHPVFLVALEQPGQHEYRGYIPPYVTHVTIIADGNEVTTACRLAHDQGARVFRVKGRAA